VEGFLGGLARRRHHCLVVVPREQIKDNVREAGVTRAQGRFGVARAILELEPDQRRALRGLKGLDNPRREVEGERQRGGHDRTEAKKIST
jgi:hypothetical protein